MQPNSKTKLQDVMSFIGEPGAPLFNIPESRQQAFIEYLNKLLLQLDEKAKKEKEKTGTSFGKQQGWQWIIEQFDTRYNGFTPLELLTMIHLITYEVAYREGFDDGHKEAKGILLQDAIQNMNKPRIITESGGVNPSRQ